jgi:hypothetical protein
VYLAVAGCIVLLVPTWLADCHDGPPWLCVDAGALATVAQVIPATVVAIFVFALGAIFVVAQIVIPGRGSRAIGELFSYTRARLVLVGGLVLLGGSLLIVLGTASSARWRLELATVLVWATIIYLVAATGLIFWTFVDQISPRRFMERLTRTPQVTFLGPRRQWTSEELFTVLRVLRGWLRTVNRIGESRDLQFALEGVLALMQSYAEDVRADPSSDPEDRRLYRQPSDYMKARESPVTRLALPACGPDDARSSDTGSASNGEKPGDKPPWFADELGRALTRAVESGVRGNTLRRDLDRLLRLFQVGIEEFAPKDGGPILAGEACMLLKHLTEVALGVRQSEESQREWFLVPTLLLAELVTYLEQVEAGSAEQLRPECALARTALVGWLLAADAFIQAHPAAGRSAVEDDLVDRCIPPARAESTWRPLTRQEWSALEPDWDVLLESCDARHDRLQGLLDKADARR